MSILKREIRFVNLLREITTYVLYKMIPHWQAHDRIIFPSREVLTKILQKNVAKSTNFV